MRALLLAAGILAATGALGESLDRTPLAATTAGGDKVLLHPNGRWEYLDPAKAAAAQEVAGRFPENNMRPVDAQGGVFGFGRTLMPGDKEYNRGSLNPKLH